MEEKRMIEEAPPDRKAQNNGMLKTYMQRVGFLFTLLRTDVEASLGALDRGESTSL